MAHLAAIAIVSADIAASCLRLIGLEAPEVARARAAAAALVAAAPPPPSSP